MASRWAEQQHLRSQTGTGKVQHKKNGKNKHCKEKRVGLESLENGRQWQIQIAVMRIRFMLVGGAGNQAFQVDSQVRIVSMRCVRRNTKSQSLRQQHQQDQHRNQCGTQRE